MYIYICIRWICVYPSYAYIYIHIYIRWIYMCTYLSYAYIYIHIYTCIYTRVHRSIYVYKHGISFSPTHQHRNTATWRTRVRRFTCYGRITLQHTATHCINTETCPKDTSPAVGIGRSGTNTQCVAICCSVLQCVAVCCMFCSGRWNRWIRYKYSVRCSVLHWVVGYVLQ